MTMMDVAAADLMDIDSEIVVEARVDDEQQADEDRYDTVVAVAAVANTCYHIP